VSNDDIGASEDLGLTAEDAEQVVGGGKKKKKVKAKAKSHPVKSINIPMGAPAAPQSQADFEAAYDKDMVEHGLDPVYGTSASEETATE